MSFCAAQLIPSGFQRLSLFITLIDVRTLNLRFLTHYPAIVHYPIDTGNIDVNGFLDRFNHGFQKIWRFADSSNMKEVVGQCFQPSGVTPSLESSFICGAMSFCSYQEGGRENRFFALYCQAKHLFDADQTLPSALKCGVAYFIVIDIHTLDLLTYCI